MATVRARAGIGTCARGSGAGTGFPRRCRNLPQRGTRDRTSPARRASASARSLAADISAPAALPASAATITAGELPGGTSHAPATASAASLAHRAAPRARFAPTRRARARRRRRAPPPPRGARSRARTRRRRRRRRATRRGRRARRGPRRRRRARERRRGGDGERGDERRKRPRGGVRRVRASVATSARGGAATGRGDGEGRGRRVDERVVLGFGFGVRRSRLAARRARRGRTRGSSRFRLAASRAGPLALASFAILRRGRSPARGFRRGRARGRPGGILRVVPGGVRGAPSRLAPRSSTLLAERRADLLLGGALLVPDRARPLTPEPRNVRAIQPAELAAHVVGDVRERAAEIPRRARRGGTRALERAALPLAARRHRARTADDDAGGK